MAAGAEMRRDVERSRAAAHARYGGYDPILPHLKERFDRFAAAARGLFSLQHEESEMSGKERDDGFDRPDYIEWRVRQIVRNTIDEQVPALVRVEVETAFSAKRVIDVFKEMRDATLDLAVAKAVDAQLGRRRAEPVMTTATGHGDPVAISAGDGTMRVLTDEKYLEAWNMPRFPQPQAWARDPDGWRETIEKWAERVCPDEPETRRKVLKGVMRRMVTASHAIAQALDAMDGEDSE